MLKDLNELSRLYTKDRTQFRKARDLIQKRYVHANSQFAGNPFLSIPRTAGYPTAIPAEQPSVLARYVAVNSSSPSHVTPPFHSTYGQRSLSSPPQMSSDGTFQRVEIFSDFKNLWVPTIALLDRASFGRNGNLVSERFLSVDLRDAHDGLRSTINGTAGPSTSLGAVTLKLQATEKGTLEAGLLYFPEFRVASGPQHFDILLGRSFLEKVEEGATHFTYQGSGRKRGPSNLSHVHPRLPLTSSAEPTDAERAEAERRRQQREKLERERRGQPHHRSRITSIRVKLLGM